MFSDVYLDPMFIWTLLSDMICALGESTGSYALKNIHRKMMDDPEGRQILEYVQPFKNCYSEQHAQILASTCENTLV
jgi:hypothetical protein